MFSKKRNVSLDITLDEGFDGIMYGSPEESLGCKLKGKVVLENKASLSVKQLTLVFLGITSVACGPPMSSSRPEYTETQTIYRKQFLFHNSTTSSKKIHAGIHEYYFEIDLPGNLPPSFKRTRGKIEYSCNAIIKRPRFYKDLRQRKVIHIKRCLMDQISSHNTTFTEDVLDSRIHYQINTPIMAFREGGLVQAELKLKPMNSDIVIEAVEYGLKEQINFRTTGEQQMSVITDINEDRYPLGKKEITTDPFFTNGSEPILINFRLCPWVHCDTDSPLINIRHKISYTICISETNPVVMESVLSELSPPSHSRRFSVPISSTRSDESHFNESRRGRVHRTVSLLPIPNNTNNTRQNSRNSRTLSIRTILNNHTQTRIEKRRLNFEIPIIITTKSDRSRQVPSYISIDRPPDYAVASLFPPPPEYDDNDTSILERSSHEQEDPSSEPEHAEHDEHAEH